MTDQVLLDAIEELTIRWNREPTYEEAQEYLIKKFTITKKEEIEYHQRKVYGK